MDGKRLDANKEYPVRNGAVLSLGKLKIQVLFRQ
jgi:hypothetical protein